MSKRKRTYQRDGGKREPNPLRGKKSVFADLPNPAVVAAIEEATGSFATTLPLDGQIGPLAAKVLPASLLLQVAHAMGDKDDVIGSLTIGDKTVPVRVADVHAAGMAAMARSMASISTEVAARLLGKPGVKARLFDADARAAALVPATPPAGGGKPAKQRRERRKGTAKRARSGTKK